MLKGKTKAKQGKKTEKEEKSILKQAFGGNKIGKNSKFAGT